MIDGRHRTFGFKDLTKTYFELYVVLKNKDHLTCLRRECLEGTAYDLEIFYALGSADIYGYHEKSGFFHPVQYYYSGRMPGKRQEPQAWAIECLMNKIGGNK